jgi:hypothetical protein
MAWPAGLSQSPEQRCWDRTMAAVAKPAHCFHVPAKQSEFRSGARGFVQRFWSPRHWAKQGLEFCTLLADIVGYLEVRVGRRSALERSC